MTTIFNSAIACAEEFPLAWFRLFVGDLSNDVSDDVLTNAFNKYTSFTKARVIRDRLSQKVGLVPYTTHGELISCCRQNMVSLLSQIQRTS